MALPEAEACQLCSNNIIEGDLTVRLTCKMCGKRPYHFECLDRWRRKTLGAKRDCNTGFRCPVAVGVACRGVITSTHGPFVLRTAVRAAKVAPVVVAAGPKLPPPAAVAFAPQVPLNSPPTARTASKKRAKNPTAQAPVPGASVARRMAGGAAPAAVPGDTTPSPPPPPRHAVRPRASESAPHQGLRQPGRCPHDWDGAYSALLPHTNMFSALDRLDPDQEPPSTSDKEAAALYHEPPSVKARPGQLVVSVARYNELLGLTPMSDLWCSDDDDDDDGADEVGTGSAMPSLAATGLSTNHALTSLAVRFACLPPHMRVILGLCQ